MEIDNRDMYEDVVEQMIKVYQQDVPDSPQELDAETRRLRFNLCWEEFQEMMEGLGKHFFEEGGPDAGWVEKYDYDAKKFSEQDLEKLLDGALDLIVVVLGTLAAAGIDPHEAWAEVHRTNMAKGDGPVREDGKRLKPEGWEPPDIRQCLINQGWTPPEEK